MHPFDDPDVIAGQGTIGMEILRQHAGPIHAIFVAIGGGGLISGVGAYVKAIRPDIKIIGVQSLDSDAMARSLKAGERVTLPDVGLFADGTAVRLVGEETFRVAKLVVDEIIIVDTDAICAAIKDVFQDTRSILEPSGALAVAGAKAYIERSAMTQKPGPQRNPGGDRLRRQHELRPPALRRRARRAGRIARSRVRRHHARAARQLQAFLPAGRPAQCDRIQLPGQRRQGSPCVRRRADFQPRRVRAPWRARFEQNDFKTLDLTHDELAKLHIRHLVGGKSALAQDELLYRFEFPERPGALMRFLDSMAPNWNISLFHYRNQGGDVGRILVGLQVPSGEMDEFRQFLTTLGYRYWDESANPVYKLFLG